MSPARLEKKYGFENPFVVDPLVRKAGQFFPRHRGRLLDVGCGEGADSAWFARKGFEVTAIDRNNSYLSRFNAYRRDHQLSNITLLPRDVLEFGYPRNRYDVVSCILVLCCMKRSEFERMLLPMKRAVKPGGIVIMSSRNYLDPELKEYYSHQRMIEPNTYPTRDDCCKFQYFIEKGRLQEVFEDWDTLYYYEGYASCKYNEHPKHGDSRIICRRRK